MKRSGFAPIVVIGIIALILIIGVVGYLVSRQKASGTQSQENPVFPAEPTNNSTTQTSTFDGSSTLKVIVGCSIVNGRMVCY